MKYIIYLTIILGLAITGYAGYEIYQTNKKSDQTTVLAKKIVEANDELEDENTFTPTIGEAIGLLELPKIDAELAIVEGTDPDDLEKGVGHFKESYLPRQGGQIVLSGHRDTVFKRVGELQLGDLLTVKMPYGDNSYEIVETKIVDADDLSIITLQNSKEELILTTCYPFGYIGNAPQRYIIYANPIE
ncbi:class D sortase [Cytobacillus gottheilii]|uniref:class D sortase n=1 Tax=Cytobacillus gottheilii TaxID=859144 RepID=UPI0009BA0432|nr:class D sortase [Cytobacillus gottheilii]